MSEFQKRVVTGLIGAAALALVILFGGWPGALLLAAILSLGMSYEYAQIAFSLPDRQIKLYALLSLAWLVLFLNTFLAGYEFEILIAVFLIIFCFFLFMAKFHDGLEFSQHFRELAFFLTGMVYLVFLPAFLPRIHQLPRGADWTMVFFLVVWGGDTGAYFAGKQFGGRKLYPKISPKKTVSGATGGLALGVVAALLYRAFFFREMSIAAVIFMPLFVGVVSQLGDLCESFLKRAFDKKDSGSILPGHGGFLDRFDGVVFGLPVMYACIRVFG